MTVSAVTGKPPILMLFLIALAVVFLPNTATASIPSANSSNYTVGDMIVSSSGGIANSTSYSMRFTQHYQQPVAEFNSTAFTGVLRWLRSSIFAPFLTNFIIMQSYCSNNSTMVTETFLRLNNIDTPLADDYVTCEFGCNDGYCINLEQSIQYSSLLMFSLIIPIIVSFVLFWISKTRWVKVFFLSLGVILIIAETFMALQPSFLTDNAVIKSIGDAISMLFSIYGIMVVMGFFVLVLLISLLRLIRGRYSGYGIEGMEDED